MQPSARQTIGFVATVAVVASVIVAGLAVSLRDRQEQNAILDLRRKVLAVAGLSERGSSLPPAEVTARFEASIEPEVITLATGEPDQTVDATTFDQRAETLDPATSSPAPTNKAKVLRVPHRAMVFRVIEDDSLTSLILPIAGQGLWSTMYGFVALSADLATITGITFYEHGETAGLGGEIDNPRWQALWVGRHMFDEAWNPRVEVIKGVAGPPDQDPYRVDGLAGATITGRGVTQTLHFWLGADGFGPYLERYRFMRGIS